MSEFSREVYFIASCLADLAPWVSDRYRKKDRGEITRKSHVNDLLTEVDIGVQRRLVERIRGTFPRDSIVAEEEGLDTPPDDAGARVWIIDPIDGTQNFVRGLFPVFAISIAFARDNETQAAGVALPVQDRVFLAERGCGATMDGAPIRVSTVKTLEGARVEIDCGNPAIRRPTCEQLAEVYARSGQFRCNCSAVTGLVQVAMGEADGYLHVGLAPWDYAAAALIVEEAGGKVTRFDGSPIRIFESGRSIIATNGRIHAEAMAHINRGHAG